VDYYAIAEADLIAIYCPCHRSTGGGIVKGALEKATIFSTRGDFVGAIGRCGKSATSLEDIIAHRAAQQFLIDAGIQNSDRIDTPCIDTINPKRRLRANFPGENNRQVNRRDRRLLLNEPADCKP
jgi:hypothetical protein